MNIWAELGISPTKNARDIKKAYAAKSKLVHPEEHPEEFRKLHEAYKKALDIANSNVSFFASENKKTNAPIVTAESEDNGSSLNTKKQKSPIADREKDSEQNFDFDDAIKRNIAHRNNEILQKTEIVIKNANELYSHKIKVREEDWLKIFNKDALDEIKLEPIFLEELYKFLQSHKMNEYIVKVLFNLYDIGSEDFDYLDKGRFEDIYKLIAKESLRIDSDLNNGIKLCSIVIIALLIVLLCMWGAELWFWSIFVMLPILFFILKLDKLLKRRKSFYD